MKKAFIFVISFIAGTLLNSCSNAVNNKKIDPNSIISKESYSILKELGQNKKIDDFFQIATIIEELPRDSDKQLSKDLDYLLQKSDEYNVKEVKDKLEAFKEGKIPLTSLKAIDDDKIRLYKGKYWYNMILPIYTEKNSYEYPLKVSMDDIVSIAKSEGYIYKIDGTSNEDNFTWYYKEVTTADNVKKGKGDSFSVLTDFHGNVMEVFIPSIKGTNFTLNNFQLLLKNSDIENNRYLKQILTTNELNKVSIFFENIDSNILKSNSKSENSIIYLLADVEDKRLLIVDNNNELQISVSNKKEQDSKYVKDMNILCSEFMPEDNRTKTSTMNAINIDSFIENNPSLITNQDSNREDITTNITADQGLEIIKSKVKIETGYYLDDPELRTINGIKCYLYTYSNKDYTVSAYCVDVKTGQLYKCSETMELTPIN